jgi:hypothetical protein
MGLGLRVLSSGRALTVEWALELTSLGALGSLWCPARGRGRIRTDFLSRGTQRQSVLRVDVGVLGRLWGWYGPRGDQRRAAGGRGSRRRE